MEEFNKSFRGLTSVFEVRPFLLLKIVICQNDVEVKA